MNFAKRYSGGITALPSGIECADSGFIFNSMVSGYDFGIVKTDKSGSQPDLSCDGTAFSVTQAAYNVALSAATPAVLASQNRSNVSLTVSNANLTPNLICRVEPCTPPQQPDTITGATTVCAGASQSYSISPVSSATSYTWSVSGSGTITGGQSTTNATIN